MTMLCSPLRLLRIATLLVLVISLAWTNAHAQTPPTLHYQGRLVDALGTPLEGPVHLTFSLYAAVDDVAPIWSEELDVQVVSGVFSTQLGAQVPFELPFDQPYTLGVRVGNDSELLPRQPLSSAPYALGVAQGSIGPESIGSFCTEGESLVQGAEGWECGDLRGPPGEPAIPPDPTQVIGYAQLEGIDCNIGVQDYETALPIYVMRHGIVGPDCTGQGQGGCGPAADFGQVLVESPIAQCTTQIAQAAANGTHVPDVKIDFPYADPRANEPRLRIILSDVLISSFAFGGNAEDGTQRQSMSLDFAAISWAWWPPLDADGKQPPPIMSSWNRKLSEGTIFEWSKTPKFVVTDSLPMPPANTYRAISLNSGFALSFAWTEIGRTAGSLQYDVLELRREVDAETVPLLLAISGGTALDAMTVEIPPPDPDAAGAVALQYQLADATVAMLELEFGPEGRFLERSSFGFSSLTFTNLDAGGPK